MKSDWLETFVILAITIALLACIGIACYMIVTGKGGTTVTVEIPQ